MPQEAAESITYVTLSPELVGAAYQQGEVMPCLAHAIFRSFLEAAGHHERHNVVSHREAVDVLRNVRSVGRRRAEQIVARGEDLYWQSDRGGRLWLIGLAKIAVRLGVVPWFQLHRVPVSEIRSRGGVTATVLNLTLSLRDDGRPITRARKAALSGVSERQQRRIDRSPLGSELLEEVYARYDGQPPDGEASFIDYAERLQRRIGDVRSPTTHSPATPSRASNLRKRVIRLREPLTQQAVAATDEATDRTRVFTGATRRDAVRAWERAGMPRGMLAFGKRGRWRRELVDDPTRQFT